MKETVAQTDSPLRVVEVLAVSAGGVGRHVAAVAAGLVGHPGVSVTVAGPPASLAAGPLGELLAHPGSAVTGRVVPVGARPHPKDDAVALARLRRLAVEADVVHGHGVRAAALAVLAARSVPARRRPAVVATLHNAAPAGGAGQVFRALLRVVARGADAVLVVSADLAPAVVAAGGPAPEVALVAAPARPPVRDAAAVRAELGVPQGSVLLVAVGRLAEQKGFDVLVEALAQLSGPGGPVTPWQAVIAGEGPERDALTAAVERAGVPVRLLGAREDVPDLLAAADLVVVPSRWEGQPLLLQEALRAGAAVVTTTAGGTPQVAGDGAVLVPAGEAAALAAALRRLVDDDQERHRLRERARRRAAHLPDDVAVTGRLLTLYRRLTTAERRRGRRGAASLELRGES